MFFSDPERLLAWTFCVCASAFLVTGTVVAHLAILAWLIDACNEPDKKPPEIPEL